METPEQIEARKCDEERKNRANLIMKYEDLLKRREVLISRLMRNVANLETFLYLIKKSYGGNEFEKRHNNENAEKTFASFNPGCLDDYWDIRKDAIECEKIYFELFTLRQKLKLHGIDESLKEDD